MNTTDIFFTGIALAMDAFAISVCNGIKLTKLKLHHIFITSFSFSVFQMMMPLLGWLLGSQFVEYIKKFDFLVTLVLLGSIGIKMIIDSFVGKKDVSESRQNTIGIKELFITSIATSIDALSAGVTLAFRSNVSILHAITIIGCVTFFICSSGVIIGHICAKLGEKLGDKFQFFAQK